MIVTDADRLAVVDVVIKDAQWEALGLETLASAAFQATLDVLDMSDHYWEISVLGCDDAAIAELNTQFRGKPQPTNVLSWPYAERRAERAGDPPAAPDPSDEELGDIAIAYDTCAAEAAAAGNPMADHVVHLIVHGTLHLLGYDHERDADATLMEGLETQILGKMGLPDPYRD